MKTPDYTWLFKDDGRDFATKMKDFIRENFADLLGEDIALLDHPGGLEVLRARTRAWLLGFRDAPAPV
ncbi:MAG: hypothetical protein ACYTHM_22215 [Planctomycetota bacterium]|jgi:hypothetical protein